MQTVKQVYTQTPEEERRVKAGQAGQLMTIEVLYYANPEGSETIREGDIPGPMGSVVARYYKRDLYGHEVLKFREDIFAAGLAIRLDANTWFVVIPRDIVRVYVHRQAKFFGDI